MTTDEILAGIDCSLTAIATEREQLLAARTQLAGDPPAPPQQRQQRAPQPTSRRKRGDTMNQVLEALDPADPRTAGDVGRITNLGRPLVASTLSRLVKQGVAAKADRGYLRAT